ncbi:unnamed protein product [Protopolystoma xenopodis]|uniref:Uncharacterized protein n=1 Tax=Protopolystoma xenopodis TaxID=117903 RepID=A0A3S5CK29_9PLAT|nr:unnamed protein product [Protopolystoma xenopodis]
MSEWRPASLEWKRIGKGQICLVGQPILKTFEASGSKLESRRVYSLLLGIFFWTETILNETLARRKMQPSPARMERFCEASATDVTQFDWNSFLKAG